MLFTTDAKSSFLYCFCKKKECPSGRHEIEMERRRMQEVGPGVLMNLLAKSKESWRVYWVCKWALFNRLFYPSYFQRVFFSYFPVLFLFGCCCLVSASPDNRSVVEAHTFNDETSVTDTPLFFFSPLLYSLALRHLLRLLCRLLLLLLIILNNSCIFLMPTTTNMQSPLARCREREKR